MLRYWSSIAGVSVLALAGLFVRPDSSWAEGHGGNRSHGGGHQSRGASRGSFGGNYGGRGYGRGYYGGNYGGRGYGRGYYGGLGYGRGYYGGRGYGRGYYGGLGYGRGYYGGYYGGGGYWPGYYGGYYGGLGYLGLGLGGYYPGYYSSYYPGYYAPDYSNGYTYFGTTPNYYGAASYPYAAPAADDSRLESQDVAPAGGPGGYYGQDVGPGDDEASDATGPDSRSASINVQLPANAELWFDGHRTTRTGSSRRFVSPTLDPNRDYQYHIRARWMDNGREVERTRSVTVHAGQRMTVDLRSPSTQTPYRSPRPERLPPPPSSSRNVEPAGPAEADPGDRIDDGPKRDFRQDPDDLKQDEKSIKPSRSKSPVP